MLISQIIAELELLAHPSLQESYDNAGLLTGDPSVECTGVLCTLDSTADVIGEAVSRGCNLVIAHHPIIFSGLKRLTGADYIQQTIISAIRQDVAVYAIHTNLDNVAAGVNGRIADKFGLTRRRILAPLASGLNKLQCFVPVDYADVVRDSIFAAGAGRIGNYSECSFNIRGEGTFRPNAGANPFSGKPGERHLETEIRMEMVLPAHLSSAVVAAMRKAHPYEEVAFDLLSLANEHPEFGAGLTGELPAAVTERDFLEQVKEIFRVPVVRHSPLTGRPVQRIAVCGGAGSFLIGKARAAGVDAFVTADLKYHEFFDANGGFLLADPGHFESEQYTVDLLQEVLVRKFPTFAVLKSEVITNPVRYFQ